MLSKTFINHHWFGIMFADNQVFLAVNLAIIGETRLFHIGAPPWTGLRHRFDERNGGIRGAAAELRGTAGSQMGRETCD